MPKACLPQHSWLQVVAGAFPGNVTLAYLNHAGQCPRCSVFLRTAILLLEDNANPEEETFIDALPSSSPAVQRHTARELAGKYTIPPASAKSSRSKQTVWLRYVSSHRSWRFAAGLAALVPVALFLGYRLLRPVSETTLLSQAYDRHRPSEMRIPGASAVPLASPTRGNNTGESTSTELLKIKLRAQQEFDQNPNDAAVRETLGRIAIVEHDGERARRQFEMASALDAHRPASKFDLASAYFEIAESTGDSLNYARAADLYSQYLDSVQDKDAVALFDRGLCWERQSVLLEAIEDYKAALAIETDAEWRREISRHLEKMEQLDQQASGIGDSKDSRDDLTPGGFLRMAEEQPERASLRYERYLDAAMKGWMVQPDASGETAAALRKLAVIGLEHHDFWLRDWMQSPRNGAAREADRLLSSAIVANARGDSAASLPETERAIALYTQADNRAGALRAGIERAFSLQKMLRAQDCLDQAVALRKQPALEGYAWSRAYLLLEIAACQASLGDLGGEVDHANEALKIATEDGLPSQELRSRFFVAEAEGLEGNTAASWRMQTAGLDRSATLGSPTRLYPFLLGLRNIASGLDLRWTSAALAEAAADTARRGGNVRDYGYAVEYLGKAQTEIGHDADSQRSYDTADRILPQIGERKAVAVFRADWDADRAASLAHRGQLQTALERLQLAHAEVLHADFVDVRMRHYVELADLLRLSGDNRAALEDAVHAVTEAERALAPLRTELQRRSWETKTSRAYELLVQCLLDAGQAEDALRVWEWHRVAGDRAPLAASGAQDAALPVTAPIPRTPPGTLTLVYAKILDHYVAWSIPAVSDGQARSIRAIRISDSTSQIADLASAFSRLCADRRSSLPDLTLLGGRLYGQLLAPFESDMRDSTLLRLELNDTLREVPFAALTMPGGHYLAERQASLLLPVSWTLHEPSKAIVTPEMHLLVVNGPSLPAEYDESAEIATGFVHATVLHDADTTRLQALLPAAEVFHYSGHASTDSERSGLTLGAGGEAPFTVESIAGLSLRGCRLAVLAACETDLAVSNSMEDSSNLPHALLNAGVDYVVATQWAIDSRSSRLLMLRFYKELSQRKRIATALQAAQQGLLTIPGSHPYDWSAFRVFAN
jgi:CHAT domain-containing protein/tetratricopeptide (TPR) repeat protein